MLFRSSHHLWIIFSANNLWSKVYNGKGELKYVVHFSYQSTYSSIQRWSEQTTDHHPYDWLAHSSGSVLLQESYYNGKTCPKRPWMMTMMTCCSGGMTGINQSCISISTDTTVCGYRAVFSSLPSTWYGVVSVWLTDWLNGGMGRYKHFALIKSVFNISLFFTRFYKNITV